MWVGTVTNIESQKREAELLEIKVLERTEELKLVNEKLVESNTELELFAGVASHDLQAPLRTINSYLSIVVERNEATLDEESKAFIQRIIEATKRMKLLIEDLLSYSRTNAQKIKIKIIDLNNVLIHVMEINKYLIDSRSAKIEYISLPLIDADEIQVTQLFQNLIGNGIKYNDKDVPVIKIKCDERTEDYLFSVTDNGTGMKKEYLDKIFDVFTRLQSDTPGTGLGLAICKKIVEKHGGKLWVESEIGAGSTFYFTISKQLTSGD
jgi:light-regulated signal transduction histidine kinase (bacteriophytochrome)